MELIIVLLIGIALGACFGILIERYVLSQKTTWQATPKFNTSINMYQPPKEIKRVGIILNQCEIWANTNEHEMASIYYEIIANECKKLSEEHKKSI